MKQTSFRHPEQPGPALVLILVFLIAASSAAPARAGGDAEHEVTWQDETGFAELEGAWQSRSRSQGFEAYYTASGVRVVPRADRGRGWNWALSLSGYGRGETVVPAGPARLWPSGNRIELDREDVLEWYLNDSRGLEHGFTLTRPPQELGRWMAAGSEALAPAFLELVVGGTLHPVISDDARSIDFAARKGIAELHYSELKVFDALGRELPAWFETPAGAGTRVVRIVYDDGDAVYPVTVDPLLTTPAWSVGGSGDFGVSVSTAGDVNGDGCDDVIVGARRYANGQVDEGAAFVYHGSPSGLDTTLSRQERLDELPAPLPEWAGRRLDREDAFRLVTSDGNLFFANTVSVGKDRTAVRWQKVTLNGKLLAEGQSLRPNEAHSLSNWFRAGNGGYGLIVSAHANDESGIASALDTPVRYSRQDMTLRGAVGSEVRVLVLDADASGLWESPALERSLMWLNLTELSDGKSVSRLQSLTDMQQAAAVEFGEVLSAPTHSIAGRQTEAIVAREDGIAALLRNNADRLEHPLEHGDWLYEFTTDGTVRKTHLAAMAKHLKGRPLLLAQSSDESISMLLQGEVSYLVKLDRDREPVAYGKIAMPADAPPVLLLADDDGSWLLSIGRGGTDMQRLWKARAAYE
jgi:hypothetical protein